MSKECLYCGDEANGANPTFCNSKCKIAWKKEQEEKLEKKKLVKVNSATYILVSKGKYKKEKRQWKNWMAKGRKINKHNKESNNE